MGVGLEHLFAGIAGGVGQTMLARQQEDRAREEREQMAQLGHLTELIKDPNLTPEARAALFQSAMGVATFGNKKLAAQIHDQIGPLINQSSQHQNGPHQQQNEVPGSEGPDSAPASPSLPPSGMPKFGASQPQSVFFTPEQQASQAASQAGQVAGAVSNAQLPSELTRQHSASQDALSNAKALQQQQVSLAAQNGYSPIGIGKNADGKSVLIYANGRGQQQTGDPLPDSFTTLAAQSATDEFKARSSAEVDLEADGVLRGSGIDPASATPAQRETARSTAAKIGLMAKKAGIDHVNSETLLNQAHAAYLAANPAGDKGGMTDNQFLMDYARQQKEYEDKGNKIEASIKEINDAKEQADGALRQAQTILDQLNQHGVGPKDNDVVLDKQGINWKTYNSLLAQAETAKTTAWNIAQAAKGRFKDDVEIGRGGDKSDWAYLKPVRPDFQYTPLRGLPTMPSAGKAQQPPLKGRRSKRPVTIDVPTNWINKTQP